MNNKSKAAVKKVIASQLMAIKDPITKMLVELNPEHPKLEKQRQQKQIKEQVAEMEVIYEEMLPFIKNLKKHINSITEETQICAIYLILGRVAKGMKALFLLTKEGMQYEAVETARSIQESLGLVTTFILPKYSEYLPKWFEGQIVKNSVSRKASHELLNPDELGVEISIEEMENDIYTLFSQYAHTSYAALLTSINVYTEDIDFENITGAHRSATNFQSVVKATMISLLHSLRFVYMFLLKDISESDKITKIVDKISPPPTHEDIKELIKNFGK